MSNTQIDYGYLLGYAGYGKLESASGGVYVKDSNGTSSPTGIPISLLNGSVVRNLQIPTTSSYYLNLNESIDYSGNDDIISGSGEEGNDGNDNSSPKDVASKIRMGFGTYSFNGNITFELTRNALSSIFTGGFFARNYLFNLYMSDGSQSLLIKNNVWNSVTFNYAAQQIPTCSIGFYSNNGGMDDLNITETPINNGMDDELIPYWEAGMNGAEIESFNVTFSRNVSNIYLNNDLKVPTYMRVGIIEMSLNITCFDTSLDDGLCIYFDKDTYLKIPNSTLEDVIQNKTYNISGLNSAGMRNFVITGIRNKPTENIFYFRRNEGQE